MIKVLSLFSGIGAFEKALKNQDIPFELVNYCEFDKYASKSYSLIHNEPESKNLGDITKVNVESLPPVDMVVYGFPCQDISLSGKQKGLFNEDGTLTRSGLFFNALEIINHCRPKVAIAENVKNLTSKKFAEQFKIVLDSLEEAGYNNYWKVLNSKDYGIPQNRERVFIISIRKDIDTGVFEFPEPYELKLRLKDILDKNVDESFFLNDEQVEKVKINNTNALVYDKSMLGYEEYAREYDNIMPAVTARDYKEPRLVNDTVLNECIQIADLNHYGNDQMNRVYSVEGISPTIMTVTGGGREVKIATPVLAKTLNTLDWQHVVTSQPLRIRKLTPKEYFKLQGFSEQDVDACVKGGISNTQLYKQAGNSITVDVMEEIFCMLFDEEGEFYV